MGASEIQIDASTLEAGQYEVTLESYDAASSVGSALKTDKVIVTVTSFVAPSLHNLPLVLVLPPMTPAAM